jgi:hypothetical protein
MSSPIATPEAAERGPRAWWLGLPPGKRRLLRTLFAVGVILVLIVSVLLARFLSAESVERNDDAALLQAEVGGDLAGMLNKLSGCRSNPSCVAVVKADASNPRLRRHGSVKILRLDSNTAYSLSASTGKTRVAWTVLGTLPVVQCVDVRRTGNFLSGIHVQLIGLSAPIANEGICTKRTTEEVEEEEATAAER